MERRTRGSRTSSSRLARAARVFGLSARADGASFRADGEVNGVELHLVGTRGMADPVAALKAYNLADEEDASNPTSTTSTT